MRATDAGGRRHLRGYIDVSKDERSAAAAAAATAVTSPHRLHVLFPFTNEGSVQPAVMMMMMSHGP